MQSLNATVSLKESILALEKQRALEGKLFKEQLKHTYESLKPINFIKNTFKEAVASPDFKNNILNVAIGIASGYITKKILVGRTHNPLKIFLGSLLQIGIANFVTKHPDSIKSSGLNILNKIFCGPSGTAAFIVSEEKESDSENA